MTTMQQINLSILAGQDGGLVVYELVDGEQSLVFGGDLDAVTKYMNGRMAKIVVSPDRQKDAPKPILTRETPLSSAFRRLEETDAAA